RVDTEDRQTEGERGEEREQECAEAFLRDRRSHAVRHRLHVRDGLLGIDRAYRVAQRLDQRTGCAAETGDHVKAVTALVALLLPQPGLRARDAAEAARPDVADDAHHRVPGKGPRLIGQEPLWRT